MLWPTLFPQEKDTYCVCSVLQGILRNHFIFLPQDEIAKNLTPAEKGFYVDDNKINSFLNKNGFSYEYYFHNQTPFNEPDTLLKEMKKEHGFLGYKNHVYLLEDFVDPIVNLIDPKNSYEVTNNLSDLMMKMREGQGFFGLVKKLN